MQKIMIWLQLTISFLHGFAVDEGVKRNKGRVGAKDAPGYYQKKYG